MKKLFSLFFAISLTLSACGTASTQPTPPAQTGTPTFTPKATQIPTTTITPTKNKICPIAQEEVEIKLSTFYYTKDYYPDLIEALNQGASIQKIAETFQEELTAYYSSSYILFYEIVDITNDDIPEIILENDHHAMFLGCHNGVYEILYSADYSDYLKVQVIDVNQNKMPDILIGDFYCTSFDCKYDLSILEYQGNNLSTILEAVSAYSATWVEVGDIDEDGTAEIFWRGGTPTGILDKTLREEIHVYKWDGNKFINQPVSYTSPIFRFQSIQDADREVINNNYSLALALYKNAIQNKSLDWWSLERAAYEKQINLNSSTSQPSPVPDPAEYPSLAAYAYYRIILLHLVQGQNAEAASTYQTLQDTFGSDPYAAPYIEMATAFWEAYQSTHKMYDGCAAAIQYAVEHPQILTPLGSDYHGWQSHTYVPADVCPFR